MSAYETIEAGKALLQAYVLVKEGKVNKAGRVFADAVEDPAIDPIMDGIAKSVQTLEETDNVTDDDNDDMGGMDDDNDDNDDNDDMGSTPPSVEVPASVASVLNLDIDY